MAQAEWTWLTNWNSNKNFKCRKRKEKAKETTMVTSGILQGGQIQTMAWKNEYVLKTNTEK